MSEVSASAHTEWNIEQSKPGAGTDLPARPESLQSCASSEAMPLAKLQKMLRESET